MPKGIYKSYYGCKKNQTHPPFTPTQVQKNVRKYFLKVTYPSKILKGLLLYHKLGAGKTCTSILASDEMINVAKITKIYVLTPGSLRRNWLDEYCSMCGFQADYLKKYYTFITYNYSIGWGLDDLDFNDSIVIIDEIHNIINGVINAIKNKNKAQRDSKTAFKIYKKLKTTTCKILALSGTPLYNNIYEWSLLGNLLKPKTFPSVVSVTNGELSFLPENFMSLFNENDDGEVIPKNPLQFNTMLQGIISYYPGKKGDFPDVIHEDPIQVYMTDPQEVFYWEQHVKQNQYRRPPSLALKRRDPVLYGFLSTMAVRANLYQFTRSAGNFYYPEEFREVYVPKNKRQRGEHKSLEDDFVDVSGRKDALVENDGWISKENLQYQPGEEHLPGGKLYNIYSTKIVALLVNILLHFKNKHVVFTYFKNKYGAKLISTILELCGIPTLVYSGDLVDKQRVNVLKTFNSIENRYGQIAKVLLVTGAGAEGISILEARHMHILESGPTPNIIQQAIGRVARYKSHAKLPPEERNVRIWRYWSISKGSNIIVNTTIKNKEGMTEQKSVIIPSGTPTVDQFLFDRGEKKLNSINSFLLLLQKASVTPVPKD